MFNSPEPVEEIRKFVAYLRANGYVIGLSELNAIINISVLAKVQDYRRIEKYWRALVSSSHKQWEQFPSLFENYWFPKKLKGSTKSSGQKKQGKSLPELIQEIKGESGDIKPGKDGSTVGLSSTDNENDAGGQQQGQGGASKADPLAEKPLGEWMPEDSRYLDSLIAPLQIRLKRKLLRYYRNHPHANRIDLPKSIRKAASTAGEIVSLHMKQRKSIPPKVFILVDVSKSMESHAQFFLRMARSFCQVLSARVFVFHTSLIEVTLLMKKDSSRVQEKINSVVFGFGGGTKIATNLEAFLLESKVGPSGNKIRGVGRGDIVFILSDGYDTDAPQKTLAALSAIKNKGAKIFWLHPTIDKPQSEAILYSESAISGFMAISHLGSLERLVDLIVGQRDQGYSNTMRLET